MINENITHDPTEISIIEREKILKEREYKLKENETRLNEQEAKLNEREVRLKEIEYHIEDNIEKSNTNNIIIARLRTKICRLNKEKEIRNKSKITLAEINKAIDKYLPLDTANFVRSQMKFNNRKGKYFKNGNRWKLKEKLFFLSMFYHSRKSYNLLSKLFLLPSRSTLLLLLSRCCIFPGFNDNIFKALETRANELDDRYCCLVFDEMKLAKGIIYDRQRDMVEGFENLGTYGRSIKMADYALCFMIKGLKQKWKINIGYFLTSSTIKAEILFKLINEAIIKLERAGLIVKTMICDQGPNNQRCMSKFFNITTTKTYTTINNNNIYLFYDPPHLLKNIRNNFKKHNYILNEEEISWNYLVNFYNYDKQTEIRMAPKLTDDHFELPYNRKMKVNLAAQVLSHTVAAGINTMIRSKEFSNHASITANFVNKIDGIFNLMNSNQRYSNKPHGNAITDESIIFIDEMIGIFSNLKTLKEVRLPCVLGWIISLNSIKSLWNEMRLKGYDYIITNRLNQDAVENLFSIIRAKGGSRDHPTPNQFRSAYRQAVFDNILMPPKGSNCIPDCDYLMLDLTSVITPSTQNIPPTLHHDYINKNVNITMTENIEQKENIISYITGY